jgi:peptidoglycan endopeptidase LytE
MAVMLSTSLLMFAEGGQATAAANSSVNSQDSAKSQQVVTLAKSLLGKDYQYGANGPTQFDSAGFPAFIYDKIGIDLEDNLSSLYLSGAKVSTNEILPGDLLFFSSTGSNSPNYTGIYIGGDQFIYASQSYDEVVQKSLSSGYGSKLIGARRYVNVPPNVDNKAKPVEKPNVVKPPVVEKPPVQKPPVQKPDTQTGQSDLADKIIQIGEKYMGTPYKFGSSSSTTATFDCSSFTQRVFKEAGIKLPRDSRQQSSVVKEISLNEIRKGDLVFFRSYGSSNPRITHVAIYAGDNKLLHTFGKPGVTYTKFLGTSWEKRVQKVGRVLP